eukprot:gene3512-4518_t
MGRIDLHITEEIKQAVLANCKAGKYTSFGNYTIEKTEDLDGFKFHLGNEEWVMIRASGTEPVLRVYSESSTQEKAEAILAALLLHRIGLTRYASDRTRPLLEIPYFTEIINLISHKPLNLNSVAEQFDGRERYCEAKLDKLNEVSDWVEQYRKFWASKLDALEMYLNKIQAEQKGPVAK